MTKIVITRLQIPSLLDKMGRTPAQGVPVGALAALAQERIGVRTTVIAERGQAPAPLATLIDAQGAVRQRYDLQPGSCYLLRPDQHVAARWRSFDAATVRAAVARATGNA